MRWMILKGVALLFTIILIGGCGGTDTHETSGSDLKLQKTMSETSPKAEFTVDQFTDPDTCGSCHNNIFQQWTGSMHNNALKDPVYRKVVALGSRETNGAIDVYCSKCHGPIAVMTGEIPPVDGSRAGETSMEGVQCDFCHTVSKATGIGNGAFQNEPGNTKRGPFSDSRSSYHQTEFSELHTKGEFCGMCHKVNHPGNGLPLEATYTEWKNGPYAKEGIQCQDCHMTPGPGVTKPNPGKAVDFGPDRPHIYTHDFAGGNFAVTKILGSEEHSLLAQERLKAAGKIDIPASSIKKTDSGFDFQVRVSNVGAGHYLPTGLTETREMWLEITVRDNLGNVLWHSGMLDQKGNINKGSVVYNTVILDKNGRHTDKVWEAAKIGSDHRIPPKSSVLENFSVKKEGIKGKINITARLLYRSAPQRVIDMVFEKETFKVPVLEMTKQNITVSL